MSDTKEIIKYVRGCIDGVQKVTFGKDTVKALLNALEQSEARVKSRNNHIHKLLGEALENERNLDGMKSRWQAAEAENTRLTKMVDWLANQLYCPSEFTNCAVDCAECRKEAARRAVAAGGGTMPEVMPCPNPKCGSSDCECLVCTINADESQTIHFHMACNKCFTSGPIADDAESAKKLWDSLPRSLRWTHEPPKVAGWYWRKETMADRAHVFHFTGNWEDYGERWESDRVCQLPLILNGNLWAGPIPAPLD